MICMAPKKQYRALAAIDPDALASFQAGIRKRYSDEAILGELRACAERIGRSPTMREFAADEQTTVHPQTVIEHFGSWNRAKRAAGLVPRRFATREELLSRLRALGEELGRTPTARDIDARKGATPSKSLYWHTFGSLAQALREAGFDVAPSAHVVADDETEIAALLARLADAGHRLIITTGGTGLTPTDVTPAATRRVIDREAPGLAELMRAVGLASTPMAALSRGVVGTRGASLIANLPGSPKGAREGLDALLPVLRHALEQLSGGDH